MDTTNCINNETWELYAANKLAEKELASLQKHTETCELCSDIKEGIDAMPKPELLGAEVESLNKKAEEYLAAPKRKRMPIWYWGAAAALLISLGIGFMYTKTNTGDVALVTPKEKNEQPTIDTAATSKIIEKGPKEKDAVETKSKVDNYKKDRKEEKESITDEPKGTPITKDIQKREAESKDAAKALDDENITNDLSKKEVVISKATNAEKAKGVTTDVSRAAKKQKLVLPSPQMNNIFNNSYNSNLGLNSFDFKQPLDSLNYNTALQAFGNDSLEKCITSLSYIVQDVNSKFYEDALLLQAKTLIKQNKEEVAKTVLKKAIALKGKRKREAKKLLRKLK